MHEEKRSAIVAGVQGASRRGKSWSEAVTTRRFRPAWKNGSGRAYVHIQLVRSDVGFGIYAIYQACPLDSGGLDYWAGAAKIKSPLVPREEGTKGSDEPPRPGEDKNQGSSIPKRSLYQQNTTTYSGLSLVVPAPLEH